MSEGENRRVGLGRKRDREEHRTGWRGGGAGREGSGGVGLGDGVERNDSHGARIS